MAPSAGQDADALPRVLIVCEHASARFGGEAVLPLQYFRILRERGAEAWLIAHERTRAELLEAMPQEAGRMHFLPDTWLNKLMWQLGRRVPAQIGYFTFGYVSRLATQFTARRLVKRMVKSCRIDVVHQPIPVSPREPSLLHDVGAAVVIGPMNGNMDYPPAFRTQSRWRLLQGSVAVGRALSVLLHGLMPGKPRAEALLVANERTRAALPANCRGEVQMLVENGVDLGRWFPAVRATDNAGPVRFVFVGRLVDWKGVDILLDAFAKLSPADSAVLEIIGDGPVRAALEAQSRALGIAPAVRFHGWRPQPECAQMLRDADALVLPSLFECGGAVVLEAMATGIPVVATAWGGPADYLDDTCGILVAPDSRDALVAGLSAAMQRLIQSPSDRQRMGEAGRAKVQRDYDWQKKVDRIVQVYRGAMARRAGASSS